MKKVLLGSTALVAASLMAGPAFAQLELSISGSVDVHGGFASEDLDEGRRQIGITTDTTLNFNADGVADNGLEYGARINVDDETADDDQIFEIDETYVFVSGTFGEFRFGATDPAASELRFTVPTVGNGQADGDFGRYVQDDFVFGTDFRYSADDNKIVYLGEFGDFSVGASYSPTDDSIADQSRQGENDGTDAGNNDQGDLENLFTIGANYQAEFGGTSVGVSAGYVMGDFEENSPAVVAGNLEDRTEFGVGAEVGFGAVTAGGFWISSTDDANGGGEVELTQFGFGATFSTGPWAFGANALIAEQDATGTLTLGTGDIEDTVYGVGVEYTLADGLVPYADLVFFDNDQDGTANDNDGSVFLVGVTASF